MTPTSFHFAPHAPWPVLLLVTAAVVALALWAYRFAVPPLPAAARRLLPVLRIAALVMLAWLLAQPALERPSGGTPHLVVLVDRSGSMALPVAPHGIARAAAADRAVEQIRDAWRGRAVVDVRPFAATLASDSARAARPSPGATALGDAFTALGASPEGQRAAGVVVVSDGVVNAGVDPVEAARALGVPVHAVVTGQSGAPDRAVAEVEAPPTARVGQPVPVRVRVTTTEPRGTAVPVQLMDDGRELAHGTAIAPGSGADAELELRATPSRAGLAVWTARVDSLPGEISTANDARGVALEVAPGKLRVVIATGGLNWDVSFLRRSLSGDSSLAVVSFERDRGAWRALEPENAGATPVSALRGASVVVLDGVAPPEVSGEFDAALAAFVRQGGGLLALGGPSPGLARLRTGRLGGELGVVASGAGFGAAPVGRSGTPAPTAEGRDVLQWDDDPARGDRAWHEAAPLADVLGVTPGAGDRVLLAASPGPPLLLARHIGRGQVLLVNGTGFWRWSLSGVDERAADRGRTLWRRLAHWLAEPAQGEPLRVKPERWLTAAGEPVRLFATLQDLQFRPVAGASVAGELEDAAGHTHAITFAPQSAGSYVAQLDGLAPGRYHVRARATRGGAALGQAGTDFAVDRWSLELARTAPDSAALAAIAAATGGRVGTADHVAGWARSLGARALAVSRSETVKLWQSPWVFALVVGALSVEWAWRRRRGLP